MAAHSFPVPTHFISICWWFSAQKTSNGILSHNTHHSLSLLLRYGENWSSALVNCSNTNFQRRRAEGRAAPPSSLALIREWARRECFTAFIIIPWDLATRTHAHPCVLTLDGSYIRGTIRKYQNGTPKVDRKSFNIGENWNLVCCHGNKTVEFLLWSAFSRIYREEISLIIFDQNLVVHQLANLHTLKTRISLERKEILESS